TVMLRSAIALILLSAVIDYQPMATIHPPSPALAHTISELAWIAGDWQTPAGGRAQIEEHWTQPAGGTMFGVSRTIAGAKTVEFEYLRLEERNGEIFYVAHPKARCPGTDFKLTSLTAQAATFENPQHDFPKRIIYRKSADGGLTASIDGGEGTRTMAFPFQAMKR
ncbi:MAG: DUF6265 family protein, partial [Acidobacteriota bacterium]